ncbi:MAG TPA: hypothetical protein VFK50_00540 [Sphingomicrobium sp.]|nr:hypothetical protein [Sphingomicrobium sp.]
MVRSVFVGLAIFVAAMPAAAQQMNAEAFFKRATKLKGKGALAIFSGGEIKSLMREGQAAGQASKARYRAASDAGKPLPFCPPEGPQKMGSNEFMARLGAIPQAERRKIDLTEATTRIMAAKFPCRA